MSRPFGPLRTYGTLRSVNTSSKAFWLTLDGKYISGQPSNIPCLLLGWLPFGYPHVETHICRPLSDSAKASRSKAAILHGDVN